MQLDARHDVGVGEGGFGAGLVPDLPVEYHVVLLVRLVVANQRGALGTSLIRIDDHGQRLVFDVDQLECIRRNLCGGCRDRGDSVPGV